MQVTGLRTRPLLTGTWSIATVRIICSPVVDVLLGAAVRPEGGEVSVITPRQFCLGRGGNGVSKHSGTPPENPRMSQNLANGSNYCAVTRQKVTKPTATGSLTIDNKIAAQIAVHQRVVDLQSHSGGVLSDPRSKPQHRRVLTTWKDRESGCTGSTRSADGLDERDQTEDHRRRDDGDPLQRCVAARKPHAQDEKSPHP